MLFSGSFFYLSVFFAYTSFILLEFRNWGYRVFQRALACMTTTTSYSMIHSVCFFATAWRQNISKTIVWSS